MNNNGNGNDQSTFPKHVPISDVESVINLSLQSIIASSNVAFNQIIPDLINKHLTNIIEDIINEIKKKLEILDPNPEIIKTINKKVHEIVDEIVKNKVIETATNNYVTSNIKSNGGSQKYTKNTKKQIRKTKKNNCKK